MPTTLAANDLFNQIAPWLGCLVVVAIIGGILMSAARRLLTSKPAESKTSGFTLHELRRLRDRGEITEAEFERAKANFLNAAKIPGHAPPVPPADASSITKTDPPAR